MRKSLTFVLVASLALSVACSKKPDRPMLKQHVEKSTPVPAKLAKPTSTPGYSNSPSDHQTKVKRPNLNPVRVFAKSTPSPTPDRHHGSIVKDLALLHAGYQAGKLVNQLGNRSRNIPFPRPKRQAPIYHEVPRPQKPGPTHYGPPKPGAHASVKTPSKKSKPSKPATRFFRWR